VIVGAPGGTGRTTTADEGADDGPNPTRFRAITVHVYVLPAVRSSTTTGEWSFVSDRVAPPSLDEQVALYKVIGAPPLLAGLVNTTRIL
jgi:hypothetical protein